MDVDWKKWTRRGGYCAQGDFIEVELPNDRRHRVAVRDLPEEIQVTAIVARQAALSRLPNAELNAWLRNRKSALVGFRVDHRGRMEAIASVAKPGLTAEEFEVYVRAVATEADRFEYVITGQNSE